MAAYAAIVSLMNTMDHIQDHPRISNCFDKKQLESLSHLLTFLSDFVEITHSHGVLSKEYEVLESQITSAAYAAEDVIESHVVDQIHSGSIWLLDLHIVIQDIVSVKENVVNVVKEDRRLFKDHHHQQGPTCSMSAPSTSSTPPIISGGKNTTMVGFDDELVQILDALTGQQSSLQIFPIVGMGGIGKTTLARNAYEHRLTLNHFDVCAWVTISQDYSVKEIFLKLVSCQSNKSADELGRKTEQQLALELYQSLVSRRYLILLDDIWSIDVWEKIQLFFPDNNNKSRIILTTRLSNVAVHLGSSYFSMKLLGEDKSWKLFSENAFLQEGCPHELEESGKKIAKQCKGLPLLIVVIGGLLKKSSRTLELWENISNDINSIPNLSEEEQNLDILSLSYRHLPAHLKSCFLYIGIFPEDYEIHVSQIIKLWIAEGFIKPNKTQSLEKVGECYLNDLVDRNLLLVGRLRLNGKIKTCRIHDLLRDLCINAAHKEKFLYLIRFCDSLGCINKGRRILFHENFTKVNCDPLLSHTLESSSLTRSLLGEGRLPFNFRLLRVLHAVDSVYSLNDILKQVNLRCFPKIEYVSRELPSSISILWNVQTLKIGGTETCVAPSEIWSMPQLRHVVFTKMCLPEPPLRSKENDDVIVLKNLQTLKTVVNLKLSDDVCNRIPNVKKLGVVYEGLSKSSCYKYLYNIVRLHELESLICCFGDFPYFSLLMQKFKYFACSPPQSIRHLKFPNSLKKLTLFGGNDLHWEDLTTIGSLPNLEVLRLLTGSVRGSEWNPVEGEFLRLKFLFIFQLELKYWNAESVHFPVLEKLALSVLWELDEIPSGIGEIPTLALIHLLGCNEYAVISAMRILEEQQSQGNEHLRVKLDYCN